jgi:diguanylate cyclase (GGDEF)-like protein
MNTNYKIVFIIFFFLLLLSVGSSVSNYIISLKATEAQIKTQSLPLSVDNIYTAIQKNIIEPSLVASMMSNDTFVIHWLLNDEKNHQKIQNYLESIKNKYKMMVTFLVSKNTLNYYTHEGIIKHVTQEDPEDNWYYTFKNINEEHEVNLDWNQHISNDMIMFINYKIFDTDFHFLGATGVGIKISYINEMLQMFKKNYKLRVSFVNVNGDILLSDNREYKTIKNIYETKELQSHKESLLSKNNTMIEYEKNSSTYILSTKYIPELNTYILVEANLDDFTSSTKNTFYFNLSISLLLTVIIATIIIIIIRGFQKKLEGLANFDSLTMLDNRRSFSEKLHKLMLLSKHNKQNLSLLFIDLDDFKSINDSYGHHVGDMVLKEFASILKSHIRKTDISARWGGEEFIVVFTNSSAEDVLIVSNAIRKATSQNETMKSLLKRRLTISAGLVNLEENDTVDSLISKADKAMYEAKNKGKDRIHLHNA